MESGVLIRRVSGVTKRYEEAVVRPWSHHSISGGCSRCTGHKISSRKNNNSSSPIIEYSQQRPYPRAYPHQSRPFAPLQQSSSSSSPAPPADVEHLPAQYTSPSG